jgi:hypothetical protein
LIGVFVLATSGTAVSRMTCLMGGHSVLSLGMIADCCPEGPANDGAVVKAICCDLSSVGGVEADYLAHPSLSIPLVGMACQMGSLTVHVPTAIVLPAWLDTRPPPRTVTDRLVKLSVQRV